MAQLNGRLDRLERTWKVEVRGRRSSGSTPQVEAAVDLPAVFRRIWLREVATESATRGIDVPAEYLEPLTNDTPAQQAADQEAFIAWGDQFRQPGLGQSRLDAYRARARDWVVWAAAVYTIIANTPEPFAEQIESDLLAHMDLSPAASEIVEYDSPLTLRVSRMGKLVLWGEYDGPLALPASLCVALLGLHRSTAGGVWPHDCAECGYQVPPEWREPCPVCGGRTGYYAHFYQTKNQHDGLEQQP